MGGRELAGVMSIVQRQKAEKAGLPYDEDADAQTRAFIEGMVDGQSDAVYASGRLWDDGVIDPRQTRTVLGLAFSAIDSAPVGGTRQFAPFRM
jgi:acetyl-CoA carboxylase carboxyltransferase component